MRVSRRRITVRIKGSAADGGYPRLTEFLQQLEAVKSALKHTERLLSGTEERSVYYRIVELEMSSPATVVLEETPIRTSDRRATLPKVPVTERLVSTLQQIERHGRIPKTADLAALEAYRNVGTVQNRHFEEVTIKSKGKAVSIDQEFNKKIDKIIGPDQLIDGSIAGLLLAINLHNTTRFEIYPPVGPKKVACDFPAKLKKQVIAGLDHNVRVYGRLRYKHWSDLPHAISAEELEVFPPDDELPSLLDLRGVATRELDAS